MAKETPQHHIMRRQHRNTTPCLTILVNVVEKNDQTPLNVDVLDVEGDKNVTRPMGE